MERAPEPVGSWPSPSQAVLACSQSRFRAEFLSTVSASVQASPATLTAPREALSAPAHNFIYRMAVLGSFLLLPDSFPTLERLALFLPRDGMILMFENSCHGEDCCGCCSGPARQQSFILPFLTDVPRAWGGSGEWEEGQVPLRDLPAT